MSTLIVPENVPSPVEDSKTLRKAVQGWGTDEKAIISVLGHRNASQRKKIKESYLQIYKESLVDRLHSELSGDFRKAVILWTYDPAERDAKLARNALKAKKIRIKDLLVIVEIACASSPQHLMEVRRAYCSLFDCSLEEDISSTVSLPLRKVLVSLASPYRFDEEVVDLNVANSEAATLNAVIRAKKLDHDCVAWILGTRGYFQLRKTFALYKERFGNYIEQDIPACGNGDLQNLLLVVIQSICYPQKHFAQVIRNSIIGIGTDEDSLTRAIVARAERDMVGIKEEYSQKFNDNLDDDVVGDTSGHYKEFLMTLLGSRN